MSITADCITLGNDIAKVSLALNGFVRDVREARLDVDGISRELHSLQGVLDLLKEDADLFPPPLAAQTLAVLEHCGKVLTALDMCFLTLNSRELPRQERRKLWVASGKRDSALFKPVIEAHRSLIGIALDLVEATIIREAVYDKEGAQTVMVQDLEHKSDSAEEVSRILVEMGGLWVRLTKEFEKTSFEHTLREYLQCLRLYAEAIIDQRNEDEYALEQGAFVGERELFGAYIGDSPDSAIGLHGNEPLGRVLKLAMARNPEYELYQIDDIIEEGDEEEETGEELTGIPSRAPTPPPKDVKRLEQIRRSMMSPFGNPDISPTDSQFGVAAAEEAASSGAETLAQTPSQSHSHSNSQGSLDLPPTPKSSRFSKILDHVRKTSADRPITMVGSLPQTAVTTATLRSSTDIRPSTPVMQGSLVRRGSRRLSVTFKKLPMWNELDQLLGPEPDTVFGVSLQKSMEVAKGTAKTHHSGGGRASRREYPLCVQKCCLRIGEDGLEAPGIFAERGDALRVRKLKDTFSTPPKYGADVDWDRFSVYDAADLVLLYLTQLPKPLVSESTARRWVALSRQATATGGSNGTRSEHYIDFWEEALGTVRGAGPRSLFKLLLNLWADVAAAEEHNDMTAERLAACVLKPLMHVSSEKRETDFILALAFLIRKRSEYVDMLREGQNEVKRVSKAAW